MFQKHTSKVTILDHESWNDVSVKFWSQTRKIKESFWANIFISFMWRDCVERKEIWYEPSSRFASILKASARPVLSSHKVRCFYSVFKMDRNFLAVDFTLSSKRVNYSPKPAPKQRFSTLAHINILYDGV